jgi:cell division protein FtsL
MEAFEYAIRKDIRNNPIVREVDRSRQRELWQGVAVGAGIVLLLLATAWQHFELLRHGYQLEQVQNARKKEEEIGRRLRLQIQVLESPHHIAELATTRLHMVEPEGGDAVVITRAVAPDPPARSVVARR